MAKRRGCIDCKLIEPEAGQWVEGRCPRCAKAHAKSPAKPNYPREERPPTPTECLKPPVRVNSLIGMRFGRLVVQFYAGNDKWGKSLWCCLCDCGVACRVPSSRLLGNSGKDREHGQKSCGCLKSDSAQQRTNRMLRVPKARRIEICKKMRAAVKKRKPAYSMDIHRAAKLLGVSVERVEIMAQDGLIGYTHRKGAMWVSSGDVGTIIAAQERNKKRCKVSDELMAMDPRRKPHS